MAIETPEHVIYLTNQAGAEAGLEAIVPVQARSKYSFFDGKRMVLDLRAIQAEIENKPADRPVLMRNADGTPTAILRDQGMEAEELQDIMGEQYEKNEARQKASGRTIDFEGMRDRAGYWQAEAFDPMYRQALRDRVERHRRNPLTDPPRDPWATAREWGWLAPQVQVPELPWQAAG